MGGARERPGSETGIGLDAQSRAILSGDSVEFEVGDASGGRLDPSSGVAEVAALDFGKINPVTGPVYVDGAEPGDALKITIETFQQSVLGWTAIIPGFGLLADRFTEPALNIWEYEAGRHSIVPPRRVGGDMDIRDLSAGTELSLPVEVAGALFSVGDTHAAQGDRRLPHDVPRRGRTRRRVDAIFAGLCH